jgi:hypothetical protein
VRAREQSGEGNEGGESYILETFLSIYFPPYIKMKPRGIRWAGHAARIIKRRKEDKLLA